MAQFPELDAIPENSGRIGGWTEDEMDTLTRYYKKVPVGTLMKYLPGRTKGAIQLRMHQIKTNTVPGVTRG